MSAAEASSASLPESMRHADRARLEAEWETPAWSPEQEAWIKAPRPYGRPPTLEEARRLAERHARLIDAREVRSHWPDSGGGKMLPYRPAVKVQPESPAARAARLGIPTADDPYAHLKAQLVDLLDEKDVDRLTVTEQEMFDYAAEAWAEHLASTAMTAEELQAKLEVATARAQQRRTCASPTCDNVLLNKTHDVQAKYCGDPACNRQRAQQRQQQSRQRRSR